MKRAFVITLLILVILLSSCMQKGGEVEIEDDFGEFDDFEDEAVEEEEALPDYEDEAPTEVEAEEEPEADDEPEETYVQKVDGVGVEANDVKVKHLVKTDAGVNVYLKDAYERTVQYVVVGIQSVIIYPAEGEPIILNNNRLDVQLDSMRTNWVAKKEIPNGVYNRVEFNLISPATIKEHKGFEHPAKVTTRKLTADLNELKFESDTTTNLIVDVDLKNSVFINKTGIKYERFFKPKPTVKLEKVTVDDGIYVDGSLGLIPSFKESDLGIVHTPQLIQINEI